MLNIHRVKLIGILIFLTVLYIAWTVIRPTEIIRENDSSLYVRNLPSTIQGKIDWWNTNKKNIQQKYNVIKNPHDLDIFIMNFGGYEAAPTGSWDNNIDDYHCFGDVKSRKRCILNDIAMVIRGDLDKNIYFTSDGKTYVQSSDGKVTLKKEESSIYY